MIIDKERIDALHNHKISPYFRGGFLTRVDFVDANGNRSTKRVIAKTEEELYCELQKFYGLKEGNNLTIKNLYDLWINYRLSIGTAQNTVIRDQQRFEKYFSSSPFVKRNLVMTNRAEWKEFCCQAILGTARKTKPMTAKEWGSTKCILNGMLDLAVDMELIQINYLRGMKFEKNLFSQTTHKSKDTEVLNTKEENTLLKWCLRKFAETNDVAFLYPPFNLSVGMRIGECVALSWNCWVHTESGDFLRIQQSEYQDRRTYAYTVKGHTKTFHNRTVPINGEAVKYLKMIQWASQSDYWVFARQGERITSRQAEYVLEAFSKESGASMKSSHKLRKTFGSNLFKAGATSKQCSDYLGNTIEVFERCYCFDTDIDNSMRALVEAI